MTAIAPARGLVDDAGLFPPTALPMDAAVARHRADVRRAHPMLTNRFLCPASRIGELADVLGPGDQVRVGLICDTGIDGLPVALDAVAEDLRLVLAVIEFPLAKAGTAGGEAALDAVLARTPAGIPLFAEPVALGDVDALAAAVATRGDDRLVGLKARCGGVRAELFPSPEALAHFIYAVSSARVPMKATAGLHRAVRYHDPQTGFAHHGFLNILAAVVRAVAGDGEDAVTAALREEEPAVLTGVLDMAGEAALTEARAVFTSYGSCSTSRPLEEAAALGLLAG